MSQWSEADRYLLDRVRRHDGEAWSQLVAKYQGRLLAFARGQRVGQADAEDFVQDTFLNFLRGLDAYRGEASLETYLFLLLRRRIIDAARGRRVRACSAADLAGPASFPEPAAPDASASWYARRDERVAGEREALARAVTGFVRELRDDLNFPHLQLAEMLFYAQMRNQAIAQATGLDEKYVGLLKHRWVKRLRARTLEALGNVAGDAQGGDETDAGTACQISLLSEVWEEHRPSCPKRTTLGGHVLGTLDEPWARYVTFHVETLGCRFCAASLTDLRRETAEAPDAFRDRVMQSTVGFFRTSGRG
jgi:RNA polymerase sigma factor (sigma-70 family)